MPFGHPYWHSTRRRLLTLHKRQTPVEFTIRAKYCKGGIYMAFIWHFWKPGRETLLVRPPRVKKIRGGGARDRQSIYFKTYGHSEFKFYDSLFYLDYKYKGCSRKKRVAENIGEFLTARALAYWFMDDGDSYPKNQNRYYFLNTQSFIFEDQKILV